MTTEQRVPPFSAIAVPAPPVGQLWCVGAHELSPVRLGSPLRSSTAFGPEYILRKRGFAGRDQHGIAVGIRHQRNSAACPVAHA
jgi:hypothetical protein